MSLVGRWLGIQCFKHDGSLHRCWDRALILENNADYIVTATKRAKVIESNGRRWFTKEPRPVPLRKRRSVCAILLGCPHPDCALDEGCPGAPVAVTDWPVVPGLLGWNNCPD